MLTKEHADAIARKLKATIKPGSAHDLAVIEYNGRRIAQFGIRRGSNKDQGHDHLPGSLHLSAHDTMGLARCPLSFEEWIERMKKKGLIPDEKTPGTS